MNANYQLSERTALYFDSLRQLTLIYTRLVEAHNGEEYLEMTGVTESFSNFYDSLEGLLHGQLHDQIHTPEGNEI